MKRNRHCAETSSACIFLILFCFCSFLFCFGGLFLDAIVADKHLVVSKLEFQLFLCSGSLFSLFGWCLAFCIFFFSLALFFVHLLGVFVLSVCGCVRWAWYSLAVLIFYRRLFLFSLAGWTLPRRVWSSRKHFCHGLHSTLALFPSVPSSFSVWERVAYLCMRETLLLCVFCVSWVSNPISPAAVCRGRL